MKTSRRQFLVRFAQTASLFAAAINFPRIVWASWNTKAFTAENLNGAIAESYGDLPIIDSDALKLKAPSIAENGAVVPISVKTDLPVTNISVFVEKNPSPLACRFNIQPRMTANVSARIRMGETSNLIVLAEADGKLYRTSQEIKVTIGGCGG